MQNWKSLFWMVAFVIVSVCPAPAPQPQPTQAEQLSRIGKAIVKTLLSPDARQKFCSKVEVGMDGDKLEQVMCQRNGMLIAYSLVAETCLTIELPNGDAISDAGLDGVVDFGQQQDSGQEYYTNPHLNVVQGEENFLHFQKRWKSLLEEIEKDLEFIASRSFLL